MWGKSISLKMLALGLPVVRPSVCFPAESQVLIFFPWLHSQEWVRSLWVCLPRAHPNCRWLEWLQWESNPAALRRPFVSGTARSLVLQNKLCCYRQMCSQADVLAKSSLEKSWHVVIRKMKKKTLSLCLFFFFFNSLMFSSLGLSVSLEYLYLFLISRE